MTPEQHLKGFTEFCRWEKATGGSDPHMRVAELVAKERYPDDRMGQAWFVGLYTACYNVPAAEIMTTLRHYPQDVLEDVSGFEEEISEVWPFLPMRRERKAAGFGRQKLADYIVGYARFLDEFGLSYLDDTDNFDECYSLLQDSIKYNARYFTMKLYEVMHRTINNPKYPMTDIRPKKGQYARRTLTFINPQHDPYSDKPEALAEAHSLSLGLMDVLWEEGVELDWFTFEVMLCNYRQAADGRQYPGRALDSELGHYIQASAYPIKFHMMEKRLEVSPPECLGEIQGWGGRRKELGRCWPDHGYTWCDILYDYNAMIDIAEPVRRET
jgi:hypothetical protein